MYLKLKAARVEKNMSQKELAAKIGMSANTYYLKENQKKVNNNIRDFTIEEANKILITLGKNYEDIFLNSLSTE